MGKPYAEYSYYLDENGCILQKIVTSTPSDYTKYIVPEGAKSIVYVEYNSSSNFYIKKYKPFENP